MVNSCWGAILNPLANQAAPKTCCKYFPLKVFSFYFVYLCSQIHQCLLVWPELKWNTNQKGGIIPRLEKSLKNTQARMQKCIVAENELSCFPPS